MGPTSTPLPKLTNLLKPMLFCTDQSMIAVASAPDWDISAMLPLFGKIGAKEASSPMPVAMTPRQFGSDHADAASLRHFRELLLPRHALRARSP